MVDETTSHVAQALRPVLAALAEALTGDYGGHMEHLWIDLELIESRARDDGGPLHPFRFRKRVSGRSRYGLPALPDLFNVGHFSVRPDFERIRALPADDAVAYALSLIYRQTDCLLSKGKKLGGFNVALFRSSFRDACHRLRIPCEA